MRLSSWVIAGLAAFLWIATFFYPLFDFQKPGSEPQPIIVGAAYFHFFDLLRSEQPDFITTGVAIVVATIHTGGILVLARTAQVVMNTLERLQKKVSIDDAPTTIAWYDAKQYQNLLEIAEDRQSLEPSFEEWERRATLLCNKWTAEGRRIEKVFVEIPELLQWCRTQGRQPNAEARSQYAQFRFANPEPPKDNSVGRRHIAE